MLIRKIYRVFYIIHLIMIISVLVISVFHNSMFVLIGFFFWGLDLIIKLIIIIKNKIKIKEAYATVLPDDVIRIVFIVKENNSFKFNSGEYIFICIPELTIFEWHPFSISSSPLEENLCLHFAVVGNWTDKLKRLIETKGKKINNNIQNKFESSTINNYIFERKKTILSNAISEKNVSYKQSVFKNYESKIKLTKFSKQDSFINSDFKKNQKYLKLPGIYLNVIVYISGPFGNPRVLIEDPKYKMFLLVAGGIGITPMQSICNHLLIQYFRGRPLVKIKFIWVMKKRAIARSVGNYKNNFWNKNFNIDNLSSNFLEIHENEQILDSEFYISRYVK